MTVALLLSANCGTRADRWLLPGVGAVADLGGGDRDYGAQLRKPCLRGGAVLRADRDVAVAVVEEVLEGELDSHREFDRGGLAPARQPRIVVLSKHPQLALSDNMSWRSPSGA